MERTLVLPKDYPMEIPIGESLNVAPYSKDPTLYAGAIGTLEIGLIVEKDVTEGRFLVVRKISPWEYVLKRGDERDEGQKTREGCEV